MNYYEAEGEYNPATGVACPDHWDYVSNCSKEGWSGLISEAHTAIRVTMDELALLAGIVTAETVTHTLARIPMSPGPSAYSLLLEPSLFKFPA